MDYVEIEKEIVKKNKRTVCCISLWQKHSQWDRWSSDSFYNKLLTISSNIIDQNKR